MKIEPFQLERWMTTYETAARWDIAESGVSCRQVSPGRAGPVDGP